MQKLTPWIQSRFYYRNSSRPLASGFITFYVHNSTIFAPTFATKDGAQNPNPVPLDIIGQAQIWLSSAVNYDIEIRDQNGALQESILNVSVNENGSVVPGSGIEFVTTVDTDSIAFQGLGTTVNPLSSDLNVSAKADNALEIVTVAGEEGAYVADVSSDLANKLDKVNTTPQSVASTVDFDGGILVASGYFGATSPNIVFDASATSYILDNPGISLTIQKIHDNSAFSSLTMAKATSVDGVTSLLSNGANTSLSSVDLYSGSSTTQTYQHFKLENADGGTVGTFLFTGSGLDIENSATDGSGIKMPDGSLIRPQTENASLYFTNGINPSDIYSSVVLNQGQLKINGGNGVSNLGYLQIVDGQISLQVVEDGTGVPKDSIVLGDGNIELLADGNRVTVQNTSLTLGDSAKTEISLNNTEIQLLTQANSILLSQTTGLKIDIPSKGANKVLTSDLNGFATWQTPTGGGSGDLQDAYDNGELITTDATNGAVTIKRGSALDTDKVLSVENGAGTEVLSVTGEGTTQIDGAVTINNFLTTNNPVIANAPIQHKAIDSYYDSNGVLQGYIYASPTQGMVIQADASQIDEIHLIDDTFVSQKLTTASLEVSGISDLQGPATLGASVTLSGITSATPAKTLGRNASNQIVEFDNVVAGGQVDSVVAGTDITITGTATDPIVNAPGIATNASNIATNTTNIATNTTDIAGKLDSVVGGTNVTIDNTDPINPIINATGGSTGSLQDAYDNSTSPEITTDATNGALTVKRGSASDTDNIFEGENGAGTITSRITGEGGATLGQNVTIGTDYTGSFPLTIKSTGSNFFRSQGDGNIGWSGKKLDGTSRFFFNSQTGPVNNFFLDLYSLDGLTSQDIFKATYNANFEIYRNLEVTQRILQGSVTDDTSTGIQAESLRVEGDVILEGIVDATPTKALGINASDEVVSYAVNVPRVTSVTSTTTLTVDSSTTDQAAITAQSGALTIASPTGSPADGQKLVIRIKAVGTSVITWNAIFRIIGTTLPVSTTANKTIYVGVVYNSLDTKWDVVAVAEEA